MVVYGRKRPLGGLLLERRRPNRGSVEQRSQLRCGASTVTETVKGPECPALTGRLYKTVTRHFQAWGGKTAGPTYDRQEVEIAVRVTPPPATVAAQNNLIERLRPRDNTNGAPPTNNPF